MTMNWLRVVCELGIIILLMVNPNMKESASQFWLSMLSVLLLA